MLLSQSQVQTMLRERGIRCDAGHALYPKTQMCVIDRTQRARMKNRPPGLFRAACEGMTLRDHPGLARWMNPYAD